MSAGPGTQTIVMRGVSDGSNPNYSNTAASLFLVDDMSMNYYGTTPDLHLYDIERIEVLNGPQGTTFGAGAMAGALRFITNKPDPTAFSAGVDMDGGKIDGGTHNGTIEAYRQSAPDPRQDRAAALRIQRLPRRLHQQSQHDAHLGQRFGLEQFAVGGQELQQREGHRRPPRDRARSLRRTGQER